MSVSHHTHRRTSRQTHTSHQKRFTAHCLMPCGRMRYLQGLSYFAKCVLITLIQRRGPQPSPMGTRRFAQQSLMGSPRPQGALGAADGWRRLQAGGRGQIRRVKLLERDGHLDCGSQVGLFLGSPQGLHQFTFPPTVQGGSLFSTPSPALTVCRCFSMTAILTCVRCYRRAQRRPGTWEGARGAASGSTSRCETDCRPARRC